MNRILPWAFVLIAGCVVDHPIPGARTPLADVGAEDGALDAGPDGTIGSDMGPDMEADASPDVGGPDMCIQICRSNVLDGCERAPCPLGCEEGAFRCLNPLPTNPAERPMFRDAADLVVRSDESALVDIDNQAITDNEGVRIDGIHHSPFGQGAGLPTLHVFWVGSMDISGQLTVLGGGPVAIIANADVAISGTIDVSASGAPILGAGSYGGGAQECRAGASGGGGGGGNATNGGNGGASFGTQGTGGMSQNASGGTPLVGGGSGGDGCDGGRRGGGGGAIQISSRTAITITETGIVRSHGGAGRAGSKSGGGGGAGGTILLEAPELEITGMVVANGGSGGEGEHTFDDEVDGLPGTDGILPVDRGCGGNGGAGESGPGRGRDAAAGLFACGGGGSAGRIILKTRGGAPELVPGTVLSPAEDHGLVFLEMASE